MSCKHTVQTSICIPRLEVLYFVLRNGAISYTPAEEAHVYQIPSVGPKAVHPRPSCIRDIISFSFTYSHLAVLAQQLS